MAFPSLNIFNRSQKDDGRVQDTIADQDNNSKSLTFREDIVSFVKNELESRKRDRRPFELQWILNVNFLNGNQYCDINSETQSIMEIPKLYWYQEREVFNQIAPIVETRLAKLGRVDPSLKTRPATSSRDDISTSKICTSLLKGTYVNQKMHQKIKKANSWAEITGTVFHKSAWNSSKGRFLGQLDNGVVHEGDLEQTYVNSFEIYPDSPFSEDIDLCRSFIHARAVHVDEIYDLHGIEVKGTEMEVWNIAQTSVGTGGLGYTSNVQKIIPMKKKNHAMLTEYYEWPSRRFPNGRLIIVAGNELAYYGELPYVVGDEGKRGIPFIRQVCIEKPGHFWGSSIIERLIPIQRSYNAVKNRKHEFMNRCVLGVITFEQGSIDEEMLASDGIAPGSLIPYNSGHVPPQFMQNGDLPSEFSMEEQKLENLFVQISGVSSFARESAPPVGANSGIAMEIVREQDDTRISLTAENIRLAIIQVGQLWLRIYKQFAKTPRVLRYSDPNNDVLVMDWEASDITTDDVIIESENELAQTPAQRRQLVFDLFKAGLFNDPETGRLTRSTRAKILEMVELGNWESSNSLDQEHVNKAQRENMLLEKGQPPVVFEYDDDLLHITEHLKFMLSTEFETLKAKNYDAAKVIYMHVKEHEQSFQMKNAPPPQQMPIGLESTGGAD